MAASATSMKTKKTFGQWFKSRKVQQWLVIVSFMIVPVLLLLVFSYVPFAKMFEFSLYKMKSYDSKNNTYVGFKNISCSGTKKSADTSRLFFFPIKLL